MEFDIKTYGLIGKELNHSFSPSYFEEKFAIEGSDDCQYLPFPLKRVEDFVNLISDYSLNGLNVTIPYKQSIIPFLDELTNAAKSIQAVNCVSFKQGKLIGHNTDVIGFERSLAPLLNTSHSNALVLGSGGAAKAVAFVLKKLQIPYNFVSRQEREGFMTYEGIKSCLEEFPLIINATPVGTYPAIEDCPLSSLDGIGKDHLIYDLIYNPENTKLLVQAAHRGATVKSGLEMLKIQAEESWKIWTVSQ